MLYLHANRPHSHGNLSSHVCLIDSNFVLKIADYSLWYFRTEEDLNPISERDSDERDFESLLWRAPELLRIPMPSLGTQVSTYLSVISNGFYHVVPFRKVN